MPLRTGLAAQLTSPVTESTYGVAPSLSAAKFSAFKSETLKLDKTVVQGTGLLAGKLFPQTVRRVFTNWTANGAITMDMPFRGLQQWLLPMFGSYGQAASALTQDVTNPIAYTATNASPCVFTATASNYSAGAAVVLSGGSPPTGFTNGTNYFVAASPAPTANTFSLAATPGGAAINSSSTGSGTESTALLSYVSYHSPGILEGNSFTLQKGVPAADTGAVEPVTYCGGKIVDWTLSVATGQIAQLVLECDFRSELAGSTSIDPTLNASVPTLQAYTAPPAGAVWHFRQATLFTGGTVSTTTINGSPVTTVASPVAAGSVMSAQVKHTVPLDVARYFLGNNGLKSEPLQNALRDIGGQFVIEWLSSEAMYNAFAADTATALQLQFLGPTIGNGTDKATFNLLLPNVYLNGAPAPVAGPGPIQQTIPFTALDDGTNNPIQATYWTLDAS
jgi:hypothetical protein